MISTGQTDGTLAHSSCHHESRPSVQAILPPVRWRTRTCSTRGHCLSAASTMALVAIVFPPRLPSLQGHNESPRVSTIVGGREMEESTHSEVMTTLHSQSTHRSLSDSAENPAKTTEWTAPILAQAKKAAAACQVMGR